MMLLLSILRAAYPLKTLAKNTTPPPQMIPVLLCFLRMFLSYQIHVYGTQIYFLNHCISIIFLLCKPGCIQCTYMYRCVWVCILLIFYRVTHISCPSNRVSYIG